MNSKPLEHTRVNLNQEYESFIKAKTEQYAVDQKGKVPVEAEIPNSNMEVQKTPNEEVKEISELPKSQEMELESQVQVELGLDEPPAIVADSAENSNDWGHVISDRQLMEWWQEFSDTQSVKTASFMKTLMPTMEGEEVVVTLSPSKADVLDNVRFPFKRFITEASGGKLTGLLVKTGEVQEQDRKPYTEKEKLEYLIKKHPELDTLMQKLGLRLP